MRIKFGISRVMNRGFAVGLAVFVYTATASAQEDAAAAPEAAEEPAPAAAPEPAPAPVPVAVAAVEPAPVTEEAVPEEEAAEPEEEKKPVGVNVDVGLASIYNFRGYNVFQDEGGQMEQNALFAPSVTWSIFDTGLYIGYWGAFQLSGDNKTEMVDVGLGHEQDLYIGYDLGLADDLVTLSFALTYFFYPFADEDAAGAANPSIIEPLVGISIATVIDIGLNISYFHAIQDGIAGLRHAYFNFSLGKSFSFNKYVGMDLGMGLGIKAWANDDSPEDNIFDLHFDWGVPIQITDQLYVSPALSLAWTDLDDVGAGDEYMIYGSMNIGADF